MSAKEKEETPKVKNLFGPGGDPRRVLGEEARVIGGCDREPGEGRLDWDEFERFAEGRPIAGLAEGLGVAVAFEIGLVDDLRGAGGFLALRIEQGGYPAEWTEARKVHDLVTSVWHPSPRGGGVFRIGGPKVWNLRGALVVVVVEFDAASRRW